jgi:hypothetical protein
MSGIPWSERRLFPQDKRDDLLRLLANKRLGSEKARFKFLHLAESAVWCYYNLDLAPRDLAFARDRLDNICRLAMKLAKAVRGLPVDAHPAMKRALAAGGLDGERPEKALADFAATVEHSAMVFGLARLIASPPGPGPRRSGPDIVLVYQLGNIYWTCFERRPSAARNGLFVKLLHEVANAAEIDLGNIGETKIRRVLSVCPFNVSATEDWWVVEYRPLAPHPGPPPGGCEGTRISREKS